MLLKQFVWPWSHVSGHQFLLLLNGDSGAYFTGLLQGQSINMFKVPCLVLHMPQVISKHSFPLGDGTSTWLWSAHPFSQQLSQVLSLWGLFIPPSAHLCQDTKWHPSWLSSLWGAGTGRVRSWGKDSFFLLFPLQSRLFWASGSAAKVKILCAP